MLPFSAPVGDAVHAHIVRGNDNTIIRSLNQHFVNVKDAPYNAVGDGVTDDTTAVKAAIAVALNGVVYFPPGTYVINETLSLKRCLRLFGAGGAGSEVSLDTYPSVLKFPNNIPGIIVHRYNTNADANGVMRIESPTTTGADGSVIQFLHIQGGAGGNPGTPDTLSHGVMLRARAALMNYKVSGFKGQGVAIIGTVGSGVAATEGAPSGWFSSMSRITNCGQNGLFTSGSDANAGLALMADVAQCQGYGIQNSAFLQNTFIACQTATNTLGSYSSTGANSAAVFLGCYEEVDQPGANIIAPSMILGGGLAVRQAGNTAPFLDATANMFRANQAGVMSFMTGSGRDITSVIGGDAVNGDFLRLGDSVNFPNFIRFRTNGADADWNYANSTIYLKFTGTGTALQCGRSVTIPNSVIGNNFFIGTGGSARFIGTASAPPTSGDYAIGDHLVNISGSINGGIIGWYCVTASVASNGGTWRPIAYVAGVSAANGDVAATLTPGSSAPTARWTSPLTANRAVTLATASVTNGAKFRILRTAASTGASTLDVGTGPLKSLATGQWCDVEFDGTNWLLTAFGSV